MTTFQEEAKQLVETHRESIEHLAQYGNSLERAMAQTFLDAAGVRA